MNSNLKQYEDKMNKTLDILAKDYAAIRAGRANPAVLDKVTVDYYGAPTPINQMAAVSVTEARTLTIQPWDRSTLKEIEKAIHASDIGITRRTTVGDPSDVPPLTEERRTELSKDISKQGKRPRSAYATFAVRQWISSRP